MWYATLRARPVLARIVQARWLRSSRQIGAHAASSSAVERLELKAAFN
jgi:hypothetical protein